MGPRAGQDSAENLAPTEFRFPDRPACNRSLYRLRYPAHGLLAVVNEFFGFFRQSFRSNVQRMLLLPMSRTVASSDSLLEDHSSCGPTQLKFGSGVRTLGTVKTAYAASSLHSIAVTST